MELFKVAAFTANGRGGNPAGVIFPIEELSESKMLEIAKQIGYSETAFLEKIDNVWRIRYFAPEQEIPFCGHATIAAGAVLGSKFGAGIFDLLLNSKQQITVEAIQDSSGVWGAALQSPKTWSDKLDLDDQSAIAYAFGLLNSDLDCRLPMKRVHAGADHVVFGVGSRRRLSNIGFHFDTMAALQRRLGVATIGLIYAESEIKFHARHPFAVGGIYEDPATGAAAAAFAGYLRDIGWQTNGRIDIIQGEDIGQPCHLTAIFQPDQGSSVRVSGYTKFIA